MRFLSRNRFVRGNIKLPSSNGPNGSGGDNPKDLLTPFLEMKNKSRVPVERGFIVRLFEQEEFAFELFPQFNSFQPQPFGITIAGGLPDEVIKVQYMGIAEIMMDHSEVFIGDYIYNAQTPGLSTRNNDLFTGAIARALTPKQEGVTQLIQAIIL
ncbi:MAG: hypothetical protein ABJQ69_03495 [Ekhidna sp.]